MQLRKIIYASDGCVSSVEADGNLHEGRCDCPRPWRIKKTQFDPAYPWLVSRYTKDRRYEPVMRCSTFDSAASLVRALVWLSIASTAANSIIVKGRPHVG